MGMKANQIITRYCHLRPSVDEAKLAELLSYVPKYFHWAGSDLFNVTTSDGVRAMMVVETNSCPSGQKSMPTSDDNEMGGYRYARMMATFRHVESKVPYDLTGGLAVIYDKNETEASGYAAALAEAYGENVYLAQLPDYHVDPVASNGVDITDADRERAAEATAARQKKAVVRFDKEGVMFVKHEGEWKPMRAGFRYVTQKPWNRIPARTKSVILNPIVVCLAGGRNKMLAAKAYDLYNAELMSTGLEIRTPDTIRDVSKAEVPMWVQSLGGRAVVKVPYSNAGQGVYTITTEQELQDFMNDVPDDEHGGYSMYIVQSLIGNANWSSVSRNRSYFHVGTMPNKQCQTFAVDLRMMIMATAEGYRPVAMYSRKARKPLSRTYSPEQDTWSMLGTNLSVKKGENDWDTKTNRLILLDRKDFNTLGIGMDDLIDCYIQTLLCSIAIDQMCQKLMDADDKENDFDRDMFSSLVNDPVLQAEIMDMDDPAIAT